MLTVTPNETILTEPNTDFQRNPLSRYQRIEKVGGGTYGEVYQAIDKINGEFVAIKKIRVHKDDEGLTGHSMREISLLKMFDHPNIVQIRNVILLPKNINIVFEYLKRSLDWYIDKLKENNLKPDLRHVKTLMYHLLSGILAIHKKKIIHRDIKPSNLL